MKLNKKLDIPRPQKRRLAIAIAGSGIVPMISRPVVALKDRRLTFGNKWEYAPAPEAYDYIKIPKRHELFIGGKSLAPHSGKYFDSVNLPSRS